MLQPQQDFEITLRKLICLLTSCVLIGGALIWRGTQPL